VTPLETVCATVAVLAGMGELAIAKKWLVFSVSVRVVPPAKQPKRDTDASGIVPGRTEADTGPLPKVRAAS
jgi:hypothetical protein